MANFTTPGVYIEEVGIFHPIEGVKTSMAGFVGVTQLRGEDDCYKDQAVAVSSWGEFVSYFGRYTEQAPYMAPAVYSFFVNGGKRCFVVSVENSDDAVLIGNDGGPGKRSGLQALGDIDDVSIVAIPGITSQKVQKAMIAHCEALKYRFCILDSQQGGTITQVQLQSGKLISEKGYGAIYYPWIKAEIEKEAFDGKTERVTILIPPSGAIAGIYARVDSERNIFKAPANVAVQNAKGLESTVSARNQELLNPKGINCIRFFDGRGILVWGARTLASDPDWTYINVRRGISYLEKSISQGTQWVVFEANGPIVWNKVTESVKNFLITLWREGGLMGETPEKAFFITCDRTTMTQNDIDTGKLVMVVGVALIKPAEFLIFKIAHQTNGITA